MRGSSQAIPPNPYGARAHYAAQDLAEIDRMAGVAHAAHGYGIHNVAMGYPAYGSNNLQDSQ